MKATTERAFGGATPGPMTPADGDKRFADAAFADNPLYFLLAQQYLLSAQLVTELLDAAGLEGMQDSKARFAAKFVVDALAPTNTLPGNPEAIRTAFQTGGKSLVRGAKNMLGDIKHNGGWPSQVDPTGFEVGVNMAATPGAVVYRSDLIELIQYEPQVKRVHAIPLLFCPPWINKYYIMDLAPGRSLIEWAVQHGHTCFAISYRNPDASMRDLGLRRLPVARARSTQSRVVREITGAEAVNTVSVCLGGTLTAIGTRAQRQPRRSLDQIGHVPEHPHRLHRSGHARRLHRRGHDRGTREADGQDAASSSPTRWRTRSMRCGPTTWSSITSSTTG